MAPESDVETMPGPTLARRQYLGLAGTAVVGSLAGCAGTVEGSWPMVGRDPQSTWSNGSAGGPGDSLSVAWTESVGWLEEPDGTSSPVVGGGRVVVGLVHEASSKDSDGAVAAIGDRGRVDWTVETGGPQVSPPLIADGRVLHATEDAEVVARSLDDGAVEWRHEPGAGVVDPLRRVGDEVLFGTSDGAIRTVSIADGTERRHVPLDLPHGPWPRAAEDGSLVVTAGDAITCLDPDGDQRWSVAGPASSRGYLLGSGALFLADTTAADATLRAIELDDGTDRWSVAAPAGDLNGFALAGEELLVPAGATGSERETSRLVAFDARTGERRWSASIDAENVGRVAAGAGYGYLAATGDRLLSVDLARGEVVDSLPTDADRVPWRPVVAGDRLYGATRDGGVVAVE